MRPPSTQSPQTSSNLSGAACLLAAICLMGGCKNSAFTSTGGIINPGASGVSVPAPVPFPVSVGGQPVIPAYPWAARVLDPVVDDAAIRVPGVSRATFAIFSCDPAGRTPTPNVRAIYNLKGGRSQSLDAVSIGIAPTPGHYLAKVDAREKGTVEFVFEIQSDKKKATDSRRLLLP